MKYFQNQNTLEVFGYDETYANDLPLIQQAIQNGLIDISDSWPPAETAPSESELLINCKELATELLYETDWATFSDVVSGSPKLNNQNEFLMYRQSVRNMLVNPVTNPSFPEKPKAQWVD